jgi:hypothetical protein
MIGKLLDGFRWRVVAALKKGFLVLKTLLVEVEYMRVKVHPGAGANLHSLSLGQP